MNTSFIYKISIKIMKNYAVYKFSVSYVTTWFGVVGWIRDID